jgi:NAD(P)-dependent dehydrogenase (short-subunit alcohol dehydrogenase family)
MKLRGKNILVTGGSRGLGRVLVQELGREGANVFFCSKNKDQLVATREEMGSFFKPPQKLAAHACDISQGNDVADLFETLSRGFPSLDAVINNAGVQGPIGLFDEVDWESWRSTIETNLLGTAMVCQKAIPLLKANGRGKIINLSGGGAVGSRPRFSAYAASKAALVRLTETLADELREFHIDVNAVAPGALNTRLLDEVLAAGAGNAGPENHTRAIQQQSEGGDSMEEAARLCVYLASPESDGITGRLISAKWDSWKALGSHRSVVF